MLQILEDGRLTDSSERVVAFRKTILIMISPRGTRQFTVPTNLGFAWSGDATYTYERMRETALTERQRAFNPGGRPRHSICSDRSGAVHVARFCGHGVSQATTRRAAGMRARPQSRATSGSRAR